MAAGWPILLNASLAECLPEEGETYKCYFNWEGFLNFLVQQESCVFSAPLRENQYQVFVQNNGIQPHSLGRGCGLASKMNGFRKTNNFLISTKRTFPINVITCHSHSQKLFGWFLATARQDWCVVSPARCIAMFIITGCHDARAGRSRCHGPAL